MAVCVKLLAASILVSQLELIEEAIKRLGRAESQSAVDENARVHKLLTEGVPVEYRDTDGSVRTMQCVADRL